MTTKLDAIKARAEEASKILLGCKLADTIARSDIPALLRVVEAAQAQRFARHECGGETQVQCQACAVDAELEQALAELNQPETEGQ